MKRGAPMKRSGFKPRALPIAGRDMHVVDDDGAKVTIEEAVEAGPGTPYFVVPPDARSSEEYAKDVAEGKVRSVRILHRGTYAGSTTGVARRKERRLENPHLLLMARNQLRPCLLRVPGLCVATGPTDCCACHGNAHVWNKGLGVKAHDFFSVWGCARCHSWLDSSYSASGEERDEVFRRALALQIECWNLIAMGREMGREFKDVEAACWALKHLIERGYATRATRPHFAIPNLQRIHAR